jgi:hypothetical protein
MCRRHVDALQQDVQDVRQGQVKGHVTERHLVVALGSLLFRSNVGELLSGVEWGVVEEWDRVCAWE